MGLDATQIPEPVIAVLRRLRERGFEAYLVGGCVRDMVRGVPPKDFDVATSARPEEVQRSFSRTIPTGIQHGTVTVLAGDTGVEVTTFRSEGEYLDARRPSSVAFHTDITVDLSRRDFTINAMAFDPTEGRIVDPFGGQTDLAAGIIRCVGSAQDRFTEDGLRALRAVRFAAVLGFGLEPQTLAAIPSTLPSFQKIALERVREEFTRILLSDRPRAGLRLLQTTGLLGRFLPELDAGVGAAAGQGYDADVFEHTATAVERTPRTIELRLAALLHHLAPPGAKAGEKVARDVLTRLKYPAKTVETVALLVREHGFDEQAPASDAGLRRLVARLGPEQVAPFFDLLVALRSTRIDGAARVVQVQALRERVEAILRTSPPLNARALALDGNQIMRLLGVGPSREVGEATRFLVEQVLDDPQLNTEAGLSELLAQWAAQKRLPGSPQGFPQD